MTETSGPPGFPAGGTSPAPAAAPAGTAAAAPDRDTAIDDLEQELSVLWRRARASSQRIAREIHPEMEPSAYGLMVLLHQQGPMRLTDLAAAVGVGKPSLSRQIGMLQTLGLVEKHTDPVDGRAQPINLTVVGASRLQDTAAARRERSRQTWTDWNPEELDTLVRLLHKLNASVQPGGEPEEPEKSEEPGEPEEPSGPDRG
ncbi:MarR family winged helix-turn-helix transcriptional regulator [Arthrobacter yangruifuii]|uniref:MarR family winged helix-turn-helix transcriptional regulator n=1 Tax=Arthrobacter yangruifuii TaxID=2606616 RepID=UPI0011B3C084|nr:MarR family winged helix-turn-helix transcriptional regulator [Arthrobacter yangruifuii]